MDNNICNICGGSYVYKNGKWICSCCDNIKNEKITNEEVILLTNASAKLRLAAFDDAEELYVDFVKKYPKNPEGYWGLLLSQYGIKYEEDYDGKKIPTIYATSIESVLDNKNYNLALEYADKDQKKYYKQQAQKFESIRQEWIDKASKEPPVDVFICFKDSDEEHNITRTDDSYEAQNLYTYLISKGYSVFFSRESLRDKVSEKYEPYIFNALNTAKVMIVYSSSREYIESTWVKNEWTRFLKKIKNGEKQKNSLVVSFEKMTASDLPKAFASCQCMDASKKTFYEDLDNHIKKVINESFAPTVKIDRVELGSAKKQKTAKKNIENLKTRDLSKYKVEQLTADEKTELKTAKICLNKELYDDALESANRLLNINPKNGQALFIKLCAEEKISSDENLVGKAGTIKKINRFEQVIENSSKENATNLLKLLVSCCSMLLKKNNIEKALEYYNLISQYDFDYKDLLENLKKKAYWLVDNKKYDILAELASVLLKTITDTNEYLDFLKYLVIGFRKNGERELTIAFYNRYIEVFDCDYEILWIKLCAEIGCLDESVLHNYIANFKDYNLLKTILEYSPTEEKRNQYITTILNAVIKKIQLKEIENIDCLAQIFDETIKFTSKKNKEKILQIVLKMAGSCQLNYKFDLSEKYYAIALSENKNCHEAYWGLLQSKLKARNNNELIEQPVIISTMPDFHSAIAAAGDDERISEKYIDIKAKQLKYIENKTIENKLRQKKKKKITIISIVVAIFFAICAALGGYGSYYSSENKLLYEMTEDGAGYIVSAGKFYDEDVISIPETYNGKKVIGIGDNAFKNKNLKEIKLPVTINEIGDYAFYGCSELKTIQLPDAVDCVGKYAFANCTKLSSINLTNNITTLPEGLFENSFSDTISSITIPKNIDFIGKNVFNNCAKLNKIYIDEREKIPHNWDNNWCGSNIDNYEIIWTLKVELDYNGGTINSNKTSISVVLGEDFTCPIPTRHGYIFEGWGYTNNSQFVLLTDEDGNSKNSWNIEENVTLSAKWTPRDYDITYHLDNGQNNTDNHNSYTIETETFELQNPTKDYYSFDGWFTNSSLTNPLSSITKGTTGHIDVYAKWIPIEYGVNYVLNGGENNQQNPATYNVEDNITFATPTRDGYTFKGWFTDSEFNNSITTISRQYIGEITLYAKWEIITYSINYVLNGGANNAENKSNYTIEMDTITLLNPTREHYEFDGWFAESTFTNQVMSILKGSTENKVFYAKWTPIEYDVTYVLNGGVNNGLNPNTYNIENNITFVAPTRDGYTFKGWFTDSEFGNSITVINRQYLGEITLYAKWEIITYSINYVLSGGTNNVENKSNYTIETDTITLLNPTREHYVFDGWYKDELYNNKVTVINKGTFGEKTFYAKWTPIEYGVNYVLNGGENNQQNPATYNVEDSFEFETPTKTAYTFVGWYSDEKFTQEFSSINGQYYGEITIYAKWTPTVYSIGYEMNGGTNNPLNPTSYNVESEDIILYNPTKSGSDFRYWYMNGSPIDKISTGTYGNLKITAVFDAIYMSSGATINGLTDYGKATYSEISIPTTINGYTITSIASSAFKDVTTLTSVEIPTTVTSIGEGAFNGCSGLVSMTIPFVGGNATSNNSTSSVFGYIFGTTSYEGATQTTQKYHSSYYSYTKTFYIPTSLKNVKVLGGNLKYGAFHNCVDLENLEIMNASLIEEYGVYNCTSLKTINLPKSLKTITSSAFQNTTNLEKVYYQGEINDWATITFGNATSNPMSYANHFFIKKDADWEEITELNLTSVETIGDYSFYGFNNITTINLSTSLQSIGTYAFAYCSSVSEIVVSESVTSIGYNAFGACTSLTSITLPFIGAKATSTGSSSILGYIFDINTTGTTKIYQYYASGSDETVYIPNSLTTVNVLGGKINYGAFYNCNNLLVINLSNKIAELGINSFSGCSSIENFVIPNSIVSIQSGAFNNLSNLTNVYYEGTIRDWCKIQFASESANPLYSAKYLYIKNDEDNWNEITSLDLTGIENMNSYAFYNFDGLTELTIGNTLKSIPTYAFSKCFNLTKLDLTGVEEIKNLAFYDCDGLLYLIIPDSVKTIEKKAFAYSSNLKYIYISNDLTTIKTGSDDDYAPFVGCSKAAIYCEGSAANPGWETYWNYSRETYYEIDIEEFMFIADFKAENYTLIDGVYYYINQDKSKVYALGVADKTMTDITLYSKTTRIGYNAFSGCSSLKNITLRGLIERISNKAFENCYALTNVYYDGTIEDWCNTIIGNISADTSFSTTPMYYADHFFIKNEDIWEEVTELIIPNSITHIGIMQFYGFEYITSVIISNSVTHIKSCAFYNCYRITGIKIGENVSYIGSKAFYNCDKLTSIYIPKSVSTIVAGSSSNSPFNDCSSSLKIYCGADDVQSGWGIYWKYYSSYKLSTYFDYEYEDYIFEITTDKSSFTLIDNVYYYINEDESKVYALGVADKTVSEVTLDKRTTRISPVAFKNCSNLTSIIIPDKVEYIALEAFTGCSNLTDIYVDSSYIYKNIESLYSSGNLFLKSTTIYISKLIVDDTFTNEYLENEDIFSKTEESDYFKYSRI